MSVLRAVLWDWLAKRIGRFPAALIWFVVLVSVLVWWNWDTIVGKPGISKVVEALTPAPQASSDTFTVLLTRLKSDSDESQQALVRAALKGIDGISVLHSDQIIDPVEGAAGHERARALLERTRSNLVIWGAAVKSGDKAGAELYVTLPSTSSPLCSGRDLGLFCTSDQFRLPPAFERDIGVLIRAVAIATAYATIVDGWRNGRFIGEMMKPISDDIEKFFHSSVGVHVGDLIWLFYMWGAATTFVGEQTGDTVLLEKSTSLLKVLTQVPDCRLSPELLSCGKPPTVSRPA